jgi:excisionase family DNA binding protein
MQNNGINRLYTTEQVADKLQVNEATIRRYCRDGTIKAKKSLKMWLIAEEDLQAYINSLN